MKYFVVFVVAIIAFQFVSVSASPDPEPGLLDGLVSGVGGIVSGAIDLVGKVLQILISLLRGLLTKGEKNSADAAADATNKEFDDIIKAARKTDCPVTRYDLDDAIKALQKIAAKLVTILASINEKTLASYSDKIAADLNAGLKSLNDQVRVVVQIAVEDVRPRCAGDDVALNNVINSVIKATGKVANAVRVQLYMLALYDVHKKNLTEDVSNVILDEAAFTDSYLTIANNVARLYPIIENFEIAHQALFTASLNIIQFINSLTEIKVTNDQNLIEQTLEEAITSSIGVVRAALSEISKIRADVSAEDKELLDGSAASLVAIQAGFVNTIQSYLNPIALYDIYKDASLFPKPLSTPKKYRKEYVYFTQVQNWENTKQFCRDRGWEIASIESEAEKNELANMIASEETPRVFWLGATDVPTGNWMWADAGKSLTYTNWKPTEPNSPGSCMAMGLDSEWYDENCTVEHNLVCQIMTEI